MAANTSLLQRADAQLDQLVSGWDIYTVVLGVILVTYLIYPIFFAQDPDTHPLLLARQASASYIRQPGESPVYRALDSPHGSPLRSGLNVKDPEAPKWASGRDGDLRDVWKQALKGRTDKDAEPLRIISVMGQQTIERTPKEVMREIHIIGRILQQTRTRRIAIYLPNSVELLVAFFAASFYGFTPILIPQRQSQEGLAEILRMTQADGIIAPAGIVPSQMLAESSLKQVIWVVEKNSRHMDWSNNSEQHLKGIDVAVWHDIIEQNTESSTTEPTSAIQDHELPSVVTVWQGNTASQYEIVEYSQKTMVAAIAAQVFALPRNHRLEASDLVLSLDSLSTLYPLTITLAALFSNASIALTSSAGPNVDFASAFQGTSPTIIVATPETMARAHKEMIRDSGGIFSKIQHSSKARSLAAGVMPKASTNSTKGSPRLVYVSQKAGVASSRLSPTELTDLRILTGARFIYALTAAKVAGAIAQTNMLDYRQNELTGQKSHFGPPLSCVEIKLLDTSEYKIRDGENPVGEIVVTGPAVIGGETKVGVIGSILDDHTLTLVA